MSNKLRTTLAITIAVIVVIGAVMMVGGAAAMEVEVKIGPTAADADVADEHNVTVGALEAGDSEYWIQDAEEHTYRITLSASQIVDVLEGTTVMLDTPADGDGDPLRVLLTLTEVAEDSGW